VVDDEEAVREATLLLLELETLPARGFASAEGFFSSPTL
jgi:FixJ family two-component response regulator